MTQPPEFSEPTGTADSYEQGSRVEAAEAGLTAEVSETGDAGDRHVTATDVAGFHPHHHPVDPNLGVVQMQTGRGAVLAGTVAALLTLAALIALGFAVAGH